MVKTRNIWIFSIVGVVVIILISVLAWGAMTNWKFGQASFIELKYYRNGVLLSAPLAVVGELEGVTHFSLDVNAENTGDGAMDVIITSVSPPAVSAALPRTSLNILPGEMKTWSSELIDISQFVGTTQVINVEVTGTYTYAGQTETIVKEGVVSMQVLPDPIFGFDVTITDFTGVDDPGTEPPQICTESWVCGEWGLCTSNMQTRDCNDLNNCGTSNDMPPVSQGCSSQTVVFRTFTRNLKTVTWIMYQGIGYGLDGSTNTNRDCVSLYGRQPDLDLSIFGLNFVNGDGLYTDGAKTWITYSGVGACLQYNFKTYEDCVSSSCRSRANNAMVSTEPLEPYATEGLEIYG